MCSQTALSYALLSVLPLSSVFLSSVSSTSGHIDANEFICNMYIVILWHLIYVK